MLQEKQRLEKELGENQRREAAAARKVEERRRAARQQAEQLAAAEALPGVPLAGATQRSAEWSCDFCGRVNSADTENCAGCLQIMLAGNGNGLGGQRGGKGKRKSKAKEPSSKFVVPAQALPGARPSEAMQGSADWTCGLCGRVNSCDAQNCAAPSCRAGMQRMRLGGGGTGARREMRADYGLDLDLDLAGPAGPAAVPVVQAVPVAEAPTAQPEPEAELIEAKPKKGKPRRKGKRRYDPDAGMVHGEGTRDGAAESLPGLVGPEP